MFLTEMGLTFDELLARPVLVDQIVSYHLVPGATIKNFYVKKSDSKDLISSNAAEPTTIFTGAGAYRLGGLVWQNPRT